LALFSINYKNTTFDISYDISNVSSISKNIIFLHGWGSNKEIMSCMNIFLDYKMIFIDMPGFGKSPNELILDTNDYSNILNIFLKEKNFTKDVIIGHSFGGKVATLLNPNLLVLLSSSGILTPKPINVKIKIYLFKIFKIFKILGFTSIYKYFSSGDIKDMSQNMYEGFKKIVNEDFESNFKDFSNKAMIFWGKSDSATPLSSGKKIHSLIKNSTFYSYPEGHYFFVNNRDDISSKILKEIKGS